MCSNTQDKTCFFSDAQELSNGMGVSQQDQPVKPKKYDREEKIVELENQLASKSRLIVEIVEKHKVYQSQMQTNAKFQQENTNRMLEMQEAKVK